MASRGASSGIKKINDWLSGENKGGKVRPMDISKFDGYTLEQVENRLRNLKHEELFVFDENGKIIAAYKGNASSVEFPSSIQNVKGATVTHGHPKGAAEFGGTFSYADMKNMLDSQWKEHRATAAGQGEMNYILRKGKNANAKGFYNRLDADYPKMKASISKKYSDVYAREKKKGTSVKQAEHIARQEAVGTLNAYYKKTASEYGYEYVNRKKKYKYNR